MNKKIVKIVLVIGTIFLFLGASILPLVGGHSNKIKNEINSKNIENLDWWPMFHHDIQHGGYSTSNAPNTNNVKWSHKLLDNISSSPAIYDNKVYIGCHDNNLYCLDSETGNYLWSFSTDDWVFSSPAVFNNCVFFGSSDYNLYCVNADTGNFIWNYLTDGPISSSPTINDDKIFFGSTDNYVYCLDIDGNFLWKYKADYVVESSPAYFDNMIFIGSGQYDDGGMLYCLNANTGELIWEKYIGGMVISSPAVYNEKVYVGYCSKEITTGGISCLDAYNGDIIWAESIGRCIYLSSPALYDNKVYIGCHDGNLYCFNAENGDELWKYNSGSSIESSPAVADGKIYFGSMNNNIFCLDAITGNEIWNYTTGYLIISSPGIADDKIFIGSYDKYIYCFQDEKNPPDAPTINGPTEGKTGDHFTYTFVTEDPDGDDVFYQIDWGDGTTEDWFGPFESNELVKKTHGWQLSGKFTIMARAKDTYDNIGGWETLEVNIPRLKTTFNYQFQDLFSCLAKLFPIFRIILQR